MFYTTGPAPRSLIESYDEERAYSVKNFIDTLGKIVTVDTQLNSASHKYRSALAFLLFEMARNRGFNKSTARSFAEEYIYDFRDKKFSKWCSRLEKSLDQPLYRDNGYFRTSTVMSLDGEYEVLDPATSERVAVKALYCRFKGRMQRGRNEQLGLAGRAIPLPPVLYAVALLEATLIKDYELWVAAAAARLVLK